MPTLTPNKPISIGYKALPASGEGPGVLVLHAWWGLNPFFRELCDRLAAAGYVVVAPDLWGGVVATTEEEAQSLVDQHDGKAIYEAVTEAFAYLQSHKAVGGRGIGAIGFSFGAAWSLYLSSVQPALKAVSFFYGGYDVDFSKAEAAYLGHFADNDPWTPEEERSATENGIRAAGRELVTHTYADTGHWFFETDRPDAYAPAAAELAWERTLAFFAEKL